MGCSRVQLNKHHKTRFASKSSRNLAKLGFYRGCINVWKSAIRIDPACFSVRIQKTIKQMDELLHSMLGLRWEDSSISLQGFLLSPLLYVVRCLTLNL
ncbi:uncharacterized protein LOC142546235 [Primulina tabacum]|uniref:uncharacterized protein LOC142546235 n=1 Tax=Primulina tabacum TaxID=48773 RepID=UPI003F5AAD58